jgi:hypothetical protein
MFECLKNVGRLFDIIFEVSVKTNDFSSSRQYAPEFSVYDNIKCITLSILCKFGMNLELLFLLLLSIFLYFYLNIKN